MWTRTKLGAELDDVHDTLYLLHGGGAKVFKKLLQEFPALYSISKRNLAGTIRACTSRLIDSARQNLFVRSVSGVREGGASEQFPLLRKPHVHATHMQLSMA